MVSESNSLIFKTYRFMHHCIWNLLHKYLIFSFFEKYKYLNYHHHHHTSSVIQVLSHIREPSTRGSSIGRQPCHTPRGLAIDTVSPPLIACANFTLHMCWFSFLPCVSSTHCMWFLSSCVWDSRVPTPLVGIKKSMLRNLFWHSSSIELERIFLIGVDVGMNGHV